MAKLSLCFQSILIPTERLSERRNRMRMKRDILIIVNARGGWYAWIIPREIVLFEFFSGCDMKNTIPSHPFESAFVLFIWNLQTHRTNCVLRETKFLSFSATVSQCFSLEKKTLTGFCEQLKTAEAAGYGQSANVKVSRSVTGRIGVIEEASVS